MIISSFLLIYYFVIIYFKPIKNNISFCFILFMEFAILSIYFICIYFGYMASSSNYHLVNMRKLGKIMYYLAILYVLVCLVAFGVNILFFILNKYKR